MKIEIFYKIENGYPIIDYPPALDETFKAGTKEIIDGVEVFTPQELQDAINANKAKEDLQNQVNEANQYLASTDHKFYNGYKPKEGEDLVEIERLRDEARDFIRDNEQ